VQVGGSALHSASVEVLDEAGRRAAKRLEVTEADLAYAEGSFFTPEGQSLKLTDLLGDGPLMSEVESSPPQAFPFGTYVAVVEIDRDSATEPSLSDMTRAAIRLLHNPERGFFVLIENENVDTAGHQTDIAALIRDYREFDRAVSVAYEFYKKYPEDTLIIVTSDHETGGFGFTLALRDLSGKRGSNQVAGITDDLKRIHSIPISLKKIGAILGPRPTSAAIDGVMKEYFSDFSLAPEFKEAILSQQPISRTIFTNPTMNAFGMMIANNTQAYWLTTAHTNHPVFVAALGAGAQRFRGYQDNADFGTTLKAILEGKYER
jgi:alkaline phosphatase